MNLIEERDALTADISRMSDRLKVVNEEIRRKCLHPEFAMTDREELRTTGDEYSRNEKTVRVVHSSCSICGGEWSSEDV